MPIISHGVQEALRMSGIVKDPDAEDKSVTGILESNDLDLKQIISHLADVVSGADTSAVKLRAIDTVLKLHGVLKEQAAPPPSFNIVFTSPEDRPIGNESLKINPILVPRPRKVA